MGGLCAVESPGAKSQEATKGPWWPWASCAFPAASEDAHGWQIGKDWEKGADKKHKGFFLTTTHLDTDFYQEWQLLLVRREGVWEAKLWRPEGWGMESLWGEWWEVNRVRDGQPLGWVMTGRWDEWLDVYVLVPLLPFFFCLVVSKTFSVPFTVFYNVLQTKATPPPINTCIMFLLFIYVCNLWLNVISSMRCALNCTKLLLSL